MEIKKEKPGNVRASDKTARTRQNTRTVEAKDSVRRKSIRKCNLIRRGKILHIMTFSEPEQNSCCVAGFVIEFRFGIINASEIETNFFFLYLGFIIIGGMGFLY